ncbi:MAG: BolA family transcriptional regulator [Rickettsiales bacterium]|jgi:BolA protein|nr:BolA family transcriptional regulator [Rickettsiales bacterium]
MLKSSEIKQRLEYLNPSFIDIRDDSHAHAEHIENPTGGLTHATITIVSESFDGLPSVQRHKLIYSSLKDALASSLHALCLKTYTKEEYKKR